jgi:ribosomal-protein-alanine N-acetyltransferase
MDLIKLSCCGFARCSFDRRRCGGRSGVRRGRHDGFILSRFAAGEAEILSVAVAASRRGRGVGRALLDLHLRRLAGLGVHTVFLEVEEDNAAARSLYARAGFSEVGRRQGYYPRERDEAGAALVLRREL